MHDIVEFLGRHPPFDALDEPELEQLESSTEVEYFTAGRTIFAKAERPLDRVYVVRRGTVQLVDGDRVVDQLGEGELFGHPSMLSGHATGLEARAGEDALCYVIPAEVVTPLLARPAAIRFVARSLLDRPPAEPAPALASAGEASQRTAGSLVSRKPVVCAPDETIRGIIETMNERGASSALVRLAEDGFGILTDHDLRVKVIGRGLSLDAPVSEVMTAPAFSVGPERTGEEVVLEMLDRGFRHVPVVSARGEVLGMLTPVDLLAAEGSAPFVLRHAVNESPDVEALRDAARQLRPTVVALHDGGTSPMQIAAVISIVADALTRRLIELTLTELAAPPAAFTWLALGSLGRREAVPSSDLDSALVWDAEADDEGSEEFRYMRSLSERVVEGLSGAAGFPEDTHGASATKPLFGRSLGSWRRLIRDSIKEVGEVRAMAISLILDARPVFAYGTMADPLEPLGEGRYRGALLRLMLRLAIEHRPPTGFLRRRDSPMEFVIGHSGEHRGKLDIKHGGLLPITSIARYAALATGAQTTSTVERLRAGAEAELIGAADARTLEEAHELFWGLRLEHQVGQLREGAEPDDLIDPQRLNPLTRRYLREAFAAVRTVQKALERELRSQ